MHILSDKINKSLVDRINQLLDTKQRIIIAIDGNSTAGKSSLASFLKETGSCSVISMDHFFLRPEQRTPERLSQPGGNIDYERFTDEVNVPLRSGEPFIYYPYDCKTGELGEPVAVDQNPVIVVEGVYCMHPAFSSEIYDITVFLQVDEDEQKRRSLLRNPFLYERFINEWVPMENKYFEHFLIADKCDFVFNSNDICS